MIFDSNIVIYSTQPMYPGIKQLLAEQEVYVSAISCVEVLGYHNLQPAERIVLENFFRTARILPIDSNTISLAVSLRQQRKMSLGDAIIAGTALAYEKTLVTRNVRDFQWIEGLNLYDPINN